MDTEQPQTVTGAIVPQDVGPLGNALGATAAGKLLGVSPRRVRAYITGGRLDVVHQDKPIKVSRASVERLLAERIAVGIEKTSPVGAAGS